MGSFQNIRLSEPGVEVAALAQENSQSSRDKMYCPLLVKGGEVQGQKFREHDSEITCEPKRLQRGPTFWSGFWPQTLRRQRGGHTHFPAKKGPKNRNQAS